MVEYRVMVIIPSFSIPSSLPANMFCEPLPLNFWVETLSGIAWGRCLAIFLCSSHVRVLLSNDALPSAIHCAVSHLLFQTQITTGCFLSCP